MGEFGTTGNNKAGKAVVTTAEEFERYRRSGGHGPEKPGPMSRWLRQQARTVLEDRLDNHRQQMPELSNLFNYRAEGKKLHSLFDHVVNGVGTRADRAAIYVLAHYRLGLKADKLCPL